MRQINLFYLILIFWCCVGQCDASKSAKTKVATPSLTAKQLQQQQQLYLECSCMHATERNSSQWGSIVMNATNARGAKNNCFMIFIVGQADELVAFTLKRLQLRESCLDLVEVFPYLSTPVIENTTLPEYIWCNRSATLSHERNANQTQFGNTDMPQVIYSAGKIFGLRLTFQQPPTQQGIAATAWPLNLTADYRFLKRDNFKTDGRLIPGTFCDYYFFANTDTATALDYDIWQYFHSPRFPANYPMHIKCAYKFLGRPESRVEIVFEELQLVKLTNGCHLDTLTIFDAESAQMNAAIDVLCFVPPTRRIISSGPDLLIEFNASSNVSAKGFRGKYKFMHNEINYATVDASNSSSSSGSSKPTEAIMEAAITKPQTEVQQKTQKAYAMHEKWPNGEEICKQTFNSRFNKSGTFETSKLFISPVNAVGSITRSTPLYTNYTGRVQCRFEFRGQPNELIQIKFHDFVIPTVSKNSSSCKSNDSLQLLTQVLGKYEPVEFICGVFLPKPIMSSEPKLVLQFVGQYPNVTNKATFFYGFKAEYRFLTNFGIFSGIQQGSTCTFVYNSTERKTGTFYTPNFPGFYLENLICNYYFHGLKDERIVLRFTYFDVEGIGNCDYTTASDYVEFSNFLTIDRKFTKYCGKLENFEIHSDGRFFRVTLHSNDRFVSMGFRAYYEFVKLRNVHEMDNASTQSYVSSKGTQSVITVTTIYCLLSLINLL